MGATIETAQARTHAVIGRRVPQTRAEMDRRAGEQQCERERGLGVFSCLARPRNAFSSEPRGQREYTAISGSLACVQVLALGGGETKGSARDNGRLWWRVWQQRRCLRRQQRRCLRWQQRRCFRRQHQRSFRYLCVPSPGSQFQVYVDP